MTQAWFVCIDPVDKGKPASYLDSVDFVIEADTGSAEYKTLQAGGVINPQGENLIKWKGPYTSEAAAKTAQNPRPSPENPAAPLVQGAENLTGVQAIGDFFSRISQGNTWIRAGEVVAGLILLGIGLNAMLKGKPLQVVTGTAGKVGKVAML